MSDALRSFYDEQRSFYDAMRLFYDAMRSFYDAMRSFSENIGTVPPTCTAPISKSDSQISVPAKMYSRKINVTAKFQYQDVQQKNKTGHQISVPPKNPSFQKTPHNYCGSISQW